jgi:hypothetical protein
VTHLELVQCVRAAVAARRPVELQRLLAERGLIAFSAALGSCPARIAADALSLLPPLQRSAVLRHLPGRLREALLQPRALVLAAPRTVRRPALLLRIASAIRRRATGADA